jgi:hypothetical protein
MERELHQRDVRCGRHTAVPANGETVSLDERASAPGKAYRLRTSVPAPWGSAVRAGPSTAPRMLSRGSLMKRLLAAMTAAVMMVALGSSAALAKPNTNTFKSGPWAFSGPDSGTCGNNWANDTSNVIFTVTPNTDGSYNVVETYSQGHFVTIAGDSPASCDVTYTDHGTAIIGGVSGKFIGTVIFTVTGTFDRTASCAAPCTRSTWVLAFFGTNTWTETAWSFQYNASPSAKGLLYNQWTNASTGNFGDIASS